MDGWIPWSCRVCIHTRVLTIDLYNNNAIPPHKNKTRQEDRLEILQGLQRRMPCWGPDVDPRYVHSFLPDPLLHSIHTSHPSTHHIYTHSALAARTEGYSGADLANLLRRAALHALASSAAPAATDSIPPAMLTPGHVEAALAVTRPSTTEAQVERYRVFARKHGGRV